MKCTGKSLHQICKKDLAIDGNNLILKSITTQDIVKVVWFNVNILIRLRTA